jgi:hypothetical protein
MLSCWRPTQNIGCAVPVWSFEENPDEDAFGGFDKRYNSVHAVEVLPAVRDE